MKRFLTFVITLVLIFGTVHIAMAAPSDVGGTIIEMQNTVTEILVNVLLALITLVGAYATLYIKKSSEKLKAETEKIQEEKQRNIVNTALEYMERTAEKTVNKIEQVTAKQIRKAVKEGTVDRKALEALAQEAFNEIKETLGPEYIQVLQESLGNAEKYILNTIEEKVAELKRKG